MGDDGRARASAMYADLLTHVAAPLAEFRRRYEAFAAPFEVPAETTVDAARAGDVPGEWITAPGADEHGCVVVYFHGGGYTTGSLATHRALCARISAAAGARVFSVDYRLAPEHPYPAGPDDCLAATRAVMDAHDAQRTVLAGDSAGGSLALLTALALRDEGEPEPAGIVCLSPWIDLELTAPSLDANATSDAFVTRDGLTQLGIAFVRGAVALDDPRVSPLHADLAGLAPLYVCVSEDEAVRDDGVRLAGRARAAGVDVTLRQVPGMQHVWPLFDFLPEAAATVAEVGEFVRAVACRP